MAGPESVAPTLPGVVVLAIKNVPAGLRGKELQLFIVERMAKCDRARAIKIAEKLPILANAKIGGIDKKTGKPYATLVLGESEFDILTGKEPRPSPGKPPAAKPAQAQTPANTPKNQVTTGKPAASSTTTYRKRRLPKPDPQQRWKDTLAREKLKTRLYGLEPLYAKLKKYKDWEVNARLAGLNRRDDWGATEYVQDKFRAAKADLEDHLRRSGFSTIKEFETVLSDYVDAFEKETLAISLDMLLRYEQALDKYERTYQSQAGVLALWGELSRSRAREYYTKNEALEREIIRISASDRAGLAQQQLQKLLTESRQYSRLAEAEMDKLAARHPILKEQGFPRKRLATAEQADIQQLILKYLGDTQESIVDTWSALSKKITRIYKMNVLLKASYSEQEIAPGSIYDLAIQQRRRDVRSSEVLTDVFLTVIAIAAGLFTGGGGTVAILATGVSVGIGVYGAVDAINQYKVEAAAHRAKLLSEEPTIAWVVLALIGAGLDAKGAFTVLKEIKGTVQLFNTTGKVADLAVLEQKLSKHGQHVYDVVKKAAEAEVKYRQALKKLFTGGSGGRLMVSFFPGAQEIGRLVFVSYHLMKRGMISFEYFLAELKTQKLLKEAASYTAEELKGLKAAFEQSQNLAREITEHGQSLKLSAEQIDSFITKWAEDGGKTLTLSQLKDQMRAQAGKSLDGKGIVPGGGKPAVKVPKKEPPPSPPKKEPPAPKNAAAGAVDDITSWPPKKPQGKSPRFDAPNAAEWRYNRYRYKQYSKNKKKEELLSFEEYKQRHFNVAAKGGRPGRSGGVDQVKTRDHLVQHEGFQNVETVSLNGKFVDLIKKNAKNALDYVEVDALLKSGIPPKRLRDKLKVELKALKPGDRLIYVDKLDPSRRIVYEFGENPRVIDSRAWKAGGG